MGQGKEMWCVFNVRRGGRDKCDGGEGRGGYGEKRVSGGGWGGIDIWLRGKGVGAWGRDCVGGEGSWRKMLVSRCFVSLLGCGDAGCW